MIKYISNFDKIFCFNEVYSRINYIKIDLTYVSNITSIKSYKSINFKLFFIILTFFSNNFTVFFKSLLFLKKYIMSKNCFFHSMSTVCMFKKKSNWKVSLFEKIRILINYCIIQLDILHSQLSGKLDNRFFLDFKVVVAAFIGK